MSIFGVWKRSFYTKAIAPRFFITPLGTVQRVYWVKESHKANPVRIIYLDVYVFGIRVARFA